MQKPPGATNTEQLHIDFQGRVSDKASTCPHCGYPILFQPALSQKCSTGRPKRTDGRLRLPNGFGSIVKLSGKRRRPYWARKSQRVDLRGYGLSKSLRYCFQSSYRRMSDLHEECFRDITAFDLQPYLNDTKLSHATLEHDQNLINQMYKVGLKYKACSEDLSKFLTIGKDDDDKPGVPFTEDELTLFWNNKDVKGMDSILILCYSGWRINEFLKM
jgi:hypothetical protein